MPSPDLSAAASAVEVAEGVVDAGVAALAAAGGPDVAQALAYAAAPAAAATATAAALLECGAKGGQGATLTGAFVAEAAAALAARLDGRESQWNVEPGALDGARAFVTEWRA